MNAYISIMFKINVYINIFIHIGNTIFILNIISFAAFSQDIDTLEIPSNSFENVYRISNPTLKYSYDEISQIHNYSHNWDFDNDGIKDELYFVGTGGAHIYYFIGVILSSD